MPASFHPNENEKVTVSLDVTKDKNDKKKRKIKITVAGEDKKAIEKMKLKPFDQSVGFKEEKTDPQDDGSKRHTWEIYIGDSGAMREIIVTCAKKDSDGGDIYMRDVFDPKVKITHDEQEKLLKELRSLKH